MRNTFSMITLDCQASQSLFSSLSAAIPPIFAYLEAIPFQSYVGRDKFLVHNPGQNDHQLRRMPITDYGVFRVFRENGRFRAMKRLFDQTFQVYRKVIELLFP